MKPTVDTEAFFWKMQTGEIPLPHAVQTLGGSIQAVDAEQGTVETRFDGKIAFTNPSGAIQGGFIAAMLDDTMGPALAAVLSRGEFAPTLNLNVAFERSARVGPITGHGRVLKRGKDICFLAGELYQDGKRIASATATAVVRVPPGPRGEGAPKTP